MARQVIFVVRLFKYRKFQKPESGIIIFSELIRLQHTTILRYLMHNEKIRSLVLTKHEASDKVLNNFNVFRRTYTLLQKRDKDPGGRLQFRTVAFIRVSVSYVAMTMYRLRLELTALYFTYTM